MEVRPQHAGGPASVDACDAPRDRFRTDRTVVTSRQDNWDQHWEEYHQSAEENPAQNYRREVIFALLGIEGRGRGARILDIGSGQGDMIAAVRQRYPEAALFGVELSQSALRSPPERFRLPGSFSVICYCPWIRRRARKPGLRTRSARRSSSTSMIRHCCFETPGNTWRRSAGWRSLRPAARCRPSTNTSVIANTGGLRI